MKMCQMDTDNDKNLKIFNGFMYFFINFRQTLWTGTLRRVNKEEMSCPVGFSEDFIAVFLVKIFQIGSENDKKLKVFQFSKFLCIFC